ncbi:hypothetical protein [Trinickia sp.]|uniref:hypothetical protein n=1 Tax=Trinickia sp. TaxID=2571163 RepID=UPI003F7D2BDF
MCTHSSRSHARRHYRNRRRTSSAILRARGWMALSAKLGEPLHYVPLICMLSNGRAADRISVPKS